MTICYVKKFLHMTKKSPQAPPVVPVTNIRYVQGYAPIKKRIRVETEEID